jgi:hypothetical protein
MIQTGSGLGIAAETLPRGLVLLRRRAAGGGHEASRGRPPLHLPSPCGPQQPHGPSTAQPVTCIEPPNVGTGTGAAATVDYLRWGYMQWSFNGVRITQTEVEILDAP